MPANSSSLERIAAHSASAMARPARSSRAARAATSFCIRRRSSRSLHACIAVWKISSRAPRLILAGSTPWFTSIENARGLPMLCRRFFLGRAITAGRQPLLHPTHIDSSTRPDRNGRNLARPNQVKTEPVRETSGLRELRNCNKPRHHFHRTGRCSRTSG
jgi:hypothetical protein